AQSDWELLNLHQPLASVPVAIVEANDGKIWLSGAAGEVRCFLWDEAERTLRLVAHYESGHGLPPSVGRLNLSIVNDKVVAFTENETFVLNLERRRFEVEKSLRDFSLVAS